MIFKETIQCSLRKARLISTWTGVPATSRKGRPSILSDKLKCKLDEFLCDNISFTLPGRNNQVYDRKNDHGKSIFKSKKYILWTFNELAQIIKEEDNKGLSQLKFSKIYRYVRSKKEYIIQSNIPDVNCLCPVCESIELLCEAISNCKGNEKLKLPTKCHKIITKIGCEQLTGYCNNTCKECPSLDLEGLNDIKEICYNEWIKEKYYKKELMRCSGSDLKEKLTEKLLSLKRHYYNM